MLNRLEQVCWVGLCLVLAASSFISQAVYGPLWLLVMAAVFVIAAIYVLLLLCGVESNRAAIRRSRYIIAAAGLSLLWMLVQTWLPIHSDSRLAILGIGDMSPGWFRPVSTLSVDPSRSQWYFFVYTMPYAVMLLTLSMLTSRDRLRQLLIGIMLLGLAHALSAIAAKYQQIYLIDRQQLDGHFSAARGWFINRNHLAGWLVLCSFGALPLMLKTWRTRRQFWLAGIGAIVSLIMMIALIQSESRAGLVTIGVILILLVMLPRLARVRMGVMTRAQREPPYLILISASLLLVAAVLMFGQELLDRLAQRSFSLGERIQQWEITWHAIQQQPWFGYGAGSYAAVFQLFRELTPLRQVVFDQSHNEYLHLWLELGLLGLILWLVFIVFFFLKSLSALRKTKSSLIAAVMVAGLSVIAAALVQALVDFNLQNLVLRSYFFVIIATTLAAPLIRR